MTMSRWCVLLTLAPALATSVPPTHSACCYRDSTQVLQDVVNGIGELVLNRCGSAQPAARALMILHGSRLHRVLTAPCYWPLPAGLGP